VDAEVGRRIRALRRGKGISQEGLAKGVGLTFQQVQKYERGSNRVSASKLVHIARVLDVPASHLLGEQSDGSALPDPLLTLDPDVRALALALEQVKSPAVRRSLVQLARSLADTGDAGSASEAK
jgi:transcriptional regulator with XRE-family HTH domain